MRAPLAAMLVLAVALAGCGEQAGEPVEIVLQAADSGSEVEAVSGGEAPTQQPARAGERGHLTGFVLDDALRPVEGAVVRLPGLDAEDVTAADGAFAFADLWPGPYRVTAEAKGHRSADTVVEVARDDFVKVKFVLQRVAPPTPYHETQSFTGFADIATDGITGATMLFCPSCTFPLVVEREALTSLIIEVTREAPAGAAYYVQLRDAASRDTLASCYQCPNPAYLPLDPDALRGVPDLELRIYPLTSGVPEFNVQFDVFATSFYNEPAPEGWSVVRGDGP